jgi:hypothetical protein
MYETETEYEQFNESYESYEGEGEWEFGHETYESLESELAGELLEITSEAELDRFLGKLAKSVVKGASSFIKSPIGKAIGGVVKNVAKTALPMVGGALGSMVLPGVGTAIGSKLGSLAGGLLEVQEAEQLGEAEAEYEAAQRYVRFARAAIGNAARAPRDLPPLTVARAASISAARRYAPSLLRSDQRSSPWRQRRRPTRPPFYYPEPAPYWTYNGNGNGDGDWAAEPEPWTGDFSGEGEAPRPAAPRPQQHAEGRWVRRGGRIVVLGA